MKSCVSWPLLFAVKTVLCEKTKNLGKQVPSHLHLCPCQLQINKIHLQSNAAHSPSILYTAVNIELDKNVDIFSLLSNFQMESSATHSCSKFNSPKQLELLELTNSYESINKIIFKMSLTDDNDWSQWFICLYSFGANC